jgi:hypothetical protein
MGHRAFGEFAGDLTGIKHMYLSSTYIIIVHLMSVDFSVTSRSHVKLTFFIATQSGHADALVHS